MKSAPAITFDVEPSRRLEYAIVAVGALAWLATLAAPLTGPFAAVRAAVVLGTVLVVARHRRVGRRRIAWHDDGTWSVAGAATSGTESATLAGWNHVGRWIVLRLRLASGAVLQLVLLPDNVDEDTWRRLLVRLRRGVVDAGAADISLLP